MRLLFRIGAILFVLATIAALTASVLPGALEWPLTWIFLGVVISSPLLLIGLVVTWIVLRRRARAGTFTRPRTRDVGIVVVVGVFGLGLLVAQVPRRLAFAYSRPAFEAARETARVPGRRAQPAGRLGVYDVDAYARDPRGGVYFRVFTTMEGFGPDVVSHGFAWRPNDEGTPFGAARLSIWRYSGDWYGFRVSDDWH